VWRGIDGCGCDCGATLKFAANDILLASVLSPHPATNMSLSILSSHTFGIIRFALPCFPYHALLGYTWTIA
jgi:hypothetical protein